MSRTMHANSLAAYYDGELDEFTKRQREILEAFKRYGGLTDRQCMTKLGYHDMNAVRPRITELINRGVLLEVSNPTCPVTKKTVRVCEIAPKSSGEYLPGFAMEGAR
jgi:hypothetical protein